MHGLINRSVQTFLRTHYGAETWREVAEIVGVGIEGFEAMLTYEDRLTEELLAAAQAVLNEPREALLEDLGAWLAMTEPLRRLLRFGGSDYWDFLLSLDELQGRGQMALPDLDIPELTLQVEPGGQLVVQIGGQMPGWGAVFAGLMRAMADDYGALALIEQLPPEAGLEQVRVLLLEARFAQARSFDLAQPALGDAL